MKQGLFEMLFKNDCKTCGEQPEPVYEDQVNLRVTQLDVDTFPVYVKYPLVLIQKAGNKVEDWGTVAIVLATAALVFVPSFSKPYTDAVKIAFSQDGSPVKLTPAVAKSNTPLKIASQSSAKKDVSLSWTGELKKSPVPGDTVLRYAVNSAFGKRTAPCDGCSTFHRGVDLGTPEGTPVRAIGLPESKVDVFCNVTTGGGNQAFMRSDSIPNNEFVAVHLQSCKAGVYKAGDIVGYSGNTGYSTGPHLHVEKHIKDANGKMVAVAPEAGYIIWMLSGIAPVLPSQGSAPLAEALSEVAKDSAQKVDVDAIYAKVLPASFAISNGDQVASGFVVSPEGLALTNYHVIASGSKQKEGKRLVRFANGSSYQYKVLKLDKNLDIALIQIVAKDIKFTPVEFETEAPKVGEFLLTVSNFQGIFPSQTKGTVVDTIRVQDVLAQIESSSGLVAHGSSGSAVVNASGKVIGQVKGMIESGESDDLNRVAKPQRDRDGILSSSQQLTKFLESAK